MSTSDADLIIDNITMAPISRAPIGTPTKWDIRLRPKTPNSFISDDAASFNQQTHPNPKKSKFDDIDCVIICALTEERNMLLNACDVSPNLRVSHYDLREEFGFSFQTFTLDNISFAIIALPKMGMVSAACVAARSLIAIKPKIIGMSGICAGRLGKAPLGSIVIATSIYDYTAGKHDPSGTFLPRPDSIPIDNSLGDYLVNIFDENEEWTKVQSKWRSHDPSPSSYLDGRIVRGVIGCGSSVVDNMNVIEEVTRAQDGLAAIDMESFGVAYAANTANIPWLIVKSVQDMADGNKQAVERSYRNFASFSSGLVLVDCVLGFLKTKNSI